MRRVRSRDPRAVRTRSRILDATEELIQAHRVEDISVSQIVSAVGTSRQVYYSHFEDRDSAVTAVLERDVLEPLVAAIAEVGEDASCRDLLTAALTQDQIDDASVYLGGGVIAAMFHCLDTFQGVDDSVQRILTILSLGLSAAGASGSPYDDLPREGIGEDQPRQVMA